MKTIPANLLTRAAVNDVAYVLQDEFARPITNDSSVLHDLCLEVGITSLPYYGTDTDLEHGCPLHMWLVFDAYMGAFWKFTSHQDTAFMTAIFAWLRGGTVDKTYIMRSLETGRTSAASHAAHMICMHGGHMFGLAESSSMASHPTMKLERAQDPAFLSGILRARLYRALADKNLLPTSVPLPF